MPADFAKALRGRKEIFVGISGVSKSVPHSGGATSEEQLTDPEVRDGFLTGLSADRGSPGDPFRVMIPLERVAYIAFFEKEEKEESAGPIRRVVIE
jgi:hypothetical protein